MEKIALLTHQQERENERKTKKECHNEEIIIIQFSLSLLTFFF